MFYLRKTTESWLPLAYQISDARRNSNDNAPPDSPKRSGTSYRMGTVDYQNSASTLRPRLPLRIFEISIIDYTYIYGFGFTFFKILPYNCTRIFSEKNSAPDRPASYCK